MELYISIEPSTGDAAAIGVGGGDCGMAAEGVWRAETHILGNDFPLKPFKLIVCIFLFFLYKTHIDPKYGETAHYFTHKKLCYTLTSPFVKE